MDISFDRKRILVTGASQGIGRSVCRMLIARGAQVVGISLTKDELASVEKEFGDKFEGIACDLSNPDNVRAAIDKIGIVHHLVNNAGISISEPFLTAKQESFDKTIAVNVRSVFLLSQGVAKLMISNGIRGSIVNVSSQASSRALADHTSYCVSKAALDQLSRNMATEYLLNNVFVLQSFNLVLYRLGPHCIRVNTVNPTVVLTEMGKRAWSDPKKAKPMLARIPLGRFAEEDEVTSAIVYLLSDAASMVTGANLPVDGGMWCT